MSWSILLSTIEMMSKCSKLIIKWNHEPYESDFTASFEHFDFISVDHLRVERWKIVVDYFFYNNIPIPLKFHFIGLYCHRP